MAKITFVYPLKTQAISLTGKKCHKNCPWCGGYYLKGMKGIEEFKANGKYKSVLVSGGYDEKGKIPLAKHFSRLLELKTEGYRLNLHPGLLGPSEITMLKELSPKVSFDLNLNEERLESYQAIQAAGLEVIPHLLLGRERGKLKSELHCLEELTEFKPELLVFLVFVPVPGTAFGNSEPPDLAELEAFFAKAKLKLPETAFSLGCLKPKGVYRDKLEELALKYQFAKIVMPSRKTREKAETEGYQINEQYECCAFS